MFVGRAGDRRKPPQRYKLSKEQAGLKRKARHLQAKWLANSYKGILIRRGHAQIKKAQKKILGFN